MVDMSWNILVLPFKRQKGFVLNKAVDGFTFAEVLVVVMIISIAAMIAIPMMGSAAGIQIKSAANVISSDMEYAKNLSIARGQNYSVVFDTSAESYQINDQAGSVIKHPVKTGKDYIVDFQNETNFSSVDIFATDFNGGSTVRFDYLGSPYDQSGGGLNAGQVTLKAGEETIVINVQPVTGYISITE